jgi:hypothetical protein
MQLRQMWLSAHKKSRRTRSPRTAAELTHSNAIPTPLQDVGFVRIDGGGNEMICRRSTFER